jgi:hypothetical protein
MAIDHIVHRRRLAFDKLGEHIGTLQHVGIIMGYIHNENSMSNPHLLTCHCLKYNVATSF